MFLRIAPGQVINMDYVISFSLEGPSIKFKMNDQSDTGYEGYHGLVRLVGYESEEEAKVEFDRIFNLVSPPLASYSV